MFVLYRTDPIVFVCYKIPRCVLNSLRQVMMNDYLHPGIEEKNVTIIKNLSDK